MGLDGRLVAEYAGSDKLLKRISLIISGMIFGDMLDVAKWLRLRRKYPGRDLLLTARLPHRHRIAGNAAVVEHCLTVKPPWNAVRTGLYTPIYDGYCKSVTIHMRVTSKSHLYRQIPFLFRIASHMHIPTENRLNLYNFER